MRRIKSVSVPLVVIIVILLGFLNPVIAQDKAAEVLRSMQERYESSIEDIDDYLMVKNDHKVYYKKVNDQGTPYFKIKTKSKGGTKTSVKSKDFYYHFAKKKEEAIYKGTKNIDGRHKTHVLYIDKMEVEVSKKTTDSLKNIYLYIDSDILMVRQMEYTMKSEKESGGVQKISPVIKNKDFRNVKGMMIPYKTVTTVDLGLTGKQRQEAKENMKKLKKSLEEIPKSYREMVKKKIEKFRQMLKGSHKRVSEVVEIRVNTGMEMAEF